MCQEKEKRELKVFRGASSKILKKVLLETNYQNQQKVVFFYYKIQQAVKKCWRFLHYKITDPLALNIESNQY